MTKSLIDIKQFYFYIINTFFGLLGSKKIVVMIYEGFARMLIFQFKRVKIKGIIQICS